MHAHAKHTHTKMDTQVDMESASGTATLGARELKLQPEVHLSLAT